MLERTATHTHIGFIRRAFHFSERVFAPQHTQTHFRFKNISSWNQRYSTINMSNGKGIINNKHEMWAKAVLISISKEILTKLFCNLPADINHCLGMNNNNASNNVNKMTIYIQCTHSLLDLLKEHQRVFRQLLWYSHIFKIYLNIFHSMLALAIEHCIGSF